MIGNDWGMIFFLYADNTLLLLSSPNILIAYFLWIQHSSDNFIWSFAFRHHYPPHLSCSTPLCPLFPLLLSPTSTSSLLPNLHLSSLSLFISLVPLTFISSPLLPSLPPVLWHYIIDASLLCVSVVVRHDEDSKRKDENQRKKTAKDRKDVLNSMSIKHTLSYKTSLFLM